MPANEWVRYEKKHLRLFDRVARTVKPVFVHRFGEQKTVDLLTRIREQLKLVLPELPDIGGKKPFSEFLLFTTMYYAMYRQLTEEGLSVEEIGNLIWDTGVTFMEKVPLFITRIVGGVNFSSSYINKLQQRAQESKLRQYPGDYVYDYVPGDGVSFDYGVDYLECASVKFLRQLGAPELARFICPMDILYSERFGWGLKRTCTLADGDARCDFRFKKGGVTSIAIPPSLRKYIDQKPLK
jgi:hypothetical protein